MPTALLNPRPPAAAADIVRRAHSASADADDAIGEIARAFGPGALSLVLLFTAPRPDLDKLAAAASRAFGGTEVVGCTTAGEIGPDGYAAGTVVALGFPADHFAAKSRLIHPLDRFSIDSGAEIAGELLSPDGLGEGALWPNSFLMLLIDGLSRQEDALVAALAPSLGAVPLIGGSAGDGLEFGATFVLHGGAFHPNSAAAVMVRTRCAVEPFRLDNFRPSAQRMVVTGADTAERLVTELNAEPAAREYARIVGKDPNQLSPFIFAENPVVVRIGGDHFCRSIQKVEENGDLRFYCAVDEGLVLTVARSEDIATHLDEALATLVRGRAPAAILGFDCILRRLDADRGQRTREVSEILARHGVLGFNTYGEQYGGMHLNQTFTGAAIFPPEDSDA